MSRIAYSEEESFPGQFEIWQANCERSLAGRKGQATLRELEAALLALPQKRLVSHVVACDGDVCAVGALLLMRRAKAKAVPVEDAQRELEVEMGDRYEQSYLDTAELGEEVGMPRLVAWKLVEMNDIVLDTKWVTVEGPLRHDWQYYNGSWRNAYVALTPEERYENVLAFVRSKLKTNAAA